MQSREEATILSRGTEVGAADSFNLAAIFSLFLSEETKILLQNTLKFVLFPLAALGSCIQAVLAWKQYRIDQHNVDKKGESLGRAVIETAAALAITTAVIGALAAHSLFVLAAPVIFTAVTGFKALFHFGAACFNAGKYILNGNPEYKSHAISHAVNSVAMGLTAAAVGLVMIAAKPIYAILGVAAGLIGTVFCIYKRCTVPKPTKSDLAERLLDRQQMSEETPRSTSDLTNGLTKANSPTGSARLQQAVGQNGTYAPPAFVPQPPANKKPPRIDNTDKELDFPRPVVSGEGSINGPGFVV